MENIEYSRKKEIVIKIKKLNNKSKYIKLFNILLENNIEYSLNSNGIFFNVNKLNIETYNIINEFLNTVP